MEELSLDNILNGDDIQSLFESGSSEEPEETKEDSQEENQENKDDKSINTSEVNFEELFGANPESVGSEEGKEDKKDTHSSEGNSTSPKNKNFFSSIATAFAEEGILPNLDEEKANNIKSADDLKAAINEYIQSELDDNYKRVNDALANGVEPSTIRKYESAINYLNNITDEVLEEESDETENLRKQLIYQDYINRGFSQERATKAVNKSVEGGTDIDDAKDALAALKELYIGQYSKEIEKAKSDAKAYKDAIEERQKKVAKQLSDDKTLFFGAIKLDKPTQKRVIENISKQSYKDSATGQQFTELQKYARENPDDFTMNVGILYTLTDGFKSIDKLVNSRVKQEMKKGFKSLEERLNNSARDSDGNLNFFSGVNDSNSYIGKDIEFAV